MATYYAQKAGNINADDVWFDAYTGGSGVTGATALAGTHTLVANGYAVAINVDFTAAQITTTAPTGSGGGSFTIATGANRVVNADVLAGTTPCLVCSHATTYRVTVNCQSTTGIKGGGTANAHGMTSSSTGKITLNAYSSNSNPVLTGGGGGNTICGLSITGNSAEVIINGVIKGGTANNSCFGIYVQANANITVSTGGSILGGNGTSNGANGIYANSSFTLTVQDGVAISAGSAGTNNSGISAASTNPTLVIGNCVLTDTLYGIAVACKHVWNSTYASYKITPKTTGGEGNYYYALTVPKAKVQSGEIGDGSAIPETGTYAGGGSGINTLIGPGGLIG